jgi:hypothetical protein
MWQPIETAPKDGTRCLVYVPSLGVVGAVHELDDCGSEMTVWHADDWNGECCGCNHTEVEPTHWMPLPDAPID